MADLRIGRDRKIVYEDSPHGTLLELADDDDVH